MQNIFSLLRKLHRDRAGTGAMELGLALPMLMLLIVGMIDMSRIIANRIDVEQAAQRATDYALAIRPSDANGSYIRDEAAKADNVAAGDVTVEIFLECNGVRASSFRDICSTGQDSARFVSVEVDRNVDTLFNWAALTGLFGKKVMGNSITVQGDSIVRFQ